MQRQDSITSSYLADAASSIDPAVLAFYAGLDHVHASSPKIAESIVAELAAQRSHVKLIASENYCSLATQLAMGNLLTDKYAEGYPEHRFYAGCENVDTIELEAVNLAKSLFGAEHAYVQPHSGADANLVAFLAILATKVEGPYLQALGETNPVKVSREHWTALRGELQKQRVLALDYYSGGHLSHGYRFNISSRLFDTYSYSVDRETKRIDLDALRAQLHEVRPLILLAGYSAYSRKIDFAKMRELADEVGAVLMVDMAHFAGLVAGKVFTGDENPVPFAHVCTTTTHKTLRGPRGGMVLCKSEFADAVDKGCPALLGGPLPHVMAAKAVAFREASTPAFQTYAAKIVDNARALAEGLQARGLPVLTGGTDNHLLLVDVDQAHGLTGRQAETALRTCGLTLNRNSLPFDKNGAWYTSGLRMGTPAVTTLGMGVTEMGELANIVADVLKDVKANTRVVEGKTVKSQAKFTLAQGTVDSANARVGDLLNRFQVYPEIDFDVIRKTPWGARVLTP